ncbi:hypothetical protein SAMN04487772_10245 [[Clostridium] polysaccharolyticum]|uniref:Uncharacterized protein n=2 Tax=[Clostridium] polysaccharolyticum TaxID=29364 RepID=A0A1H9YIY8_9FIRM|nr:hypothetical protein SAMN04487772_10245 [[Clostridium] polysaccharolyticum]
MSDCNSVVERTGNDLLTEKLVLAVCQYLEEVERAERGDKPVLIEKKVTGFTPETEIKGFKVGE